MYCQNHKKHIKGKANKRLGSNLATISSTLLLLVYPVAQFSLPHAW